MRPPMYPVAPVTRTFTMCKHYCEGRFIDRQEPPPGEGISSWKGARAHTHRTPGTTRTCNLRIRSPLLYPVELRGLADGVESVGGAGDGSRTRVTSLEGWGSTIELHPRFGAGGYPCSSGIREHVVSCFNNGDALMIPVPILD